MFLANTDKTAVPPPRAHLLAALGRDGPGQVMRYLSACPIHRATPLLALPALARSIGVDSLHVKDESQRLGLKSFKALGGAYAVMKQVVAQAERRLGRTVEPGELNTAAVRAVARDITVACATAGNHGRSVAAGARLAGCRAVIFVSDTVRPDRVAAIAGFGADIVQVQGGYDDSVAEATRQAALGGWTIVSDTAWPGYEDTPLDVMQGYTVMVAEAFAALPQPPTHLFLQAGVGGLAAATAAHAADFYRVSPPRIVVVEPERAACLYESAKAGRPVTIAAQAPTIMAMLDCRQPSLLAWEILHAMADGFITLPEAAAVDAMVRLACPLGDDPAITAGESGGTGLAGLIAALDDPQACAQLGLNRHARILVVNSEGATDEALYRRLTGVDPLPRLTPEASGA